MDMVNHPKHYTSHPSGVEVIQITEHMNFCLGNAIKYILRSELKGKQIEDLKKAIWYIEREIQRLSKTILDESRAERVVIESPRVQPSVDDARKYGGAANQDADDQIIDFELVRHRKEKHTLADMYRPDCKYCNGKNWKKK